MFHTPNRNQQEDTPSTSQESQAARQTSLLQNVYRPQPNIGNEHQSQQQLQQSIQDIGENLNNNTREINASALHKLPPFWSQNPQLWFAQIESVFSLTGITRDETKFQHVIANMDPNVCEYISHIIFNPPRDKSQYTAVKEVLLKTFGKSEQTKIRELLSSVKLGDHKPSQFMQKIKNLASDHISSEAIKSIFVDEMPDPICSMFCTMTECNLDILAEKADLIFSTFKQYPVYAINKTNTNVDISEDEISVRQLVAQIKQLSDRSCGVINLLYNFLLYNSITLIIIKTFFVKSILNI